MVTYCRSVDEVFRALADPTRRALLDELFQRDGQTLGALEQRFEMTRFGVMKHLRQLEEAGLVVTKRRGREKLHFLNPVPIRLVHDRWVSKYAEPWVAGLSDLKSDWRARWRRSTRSTSAPRPSGCGRRSPTRDERGKFQFGNRVDVGLDRRFADRDEQPGQRRRAARRGRDPRGRPAAAAGPDDGGAVGRRREEPRGPRGSPGRSSRSATRAD